MKNFYLEPEEELFSIIDKIKSSQENSVALIVPAGLSALRSIINLRILREEAVSTGKNISIITSDSLIRKLAQQSGLRILEKEAVIAEETQNKEKIEPSFIKPMEGKKMMSDIVVFSRKAEEPKPAREVEEPEPEPSVEKKFAPPQDFTDQFEEEKEKNFEGLFEKPSFVKTPARVSRPKHKPSFRFFIKKRIVATLVVIVLIVGGFFLYFVLPKAKIVIDPKKEVIRFETEIVADKNINSVIVSDNAVPGQVFQLEMEDSRKFPTTGEKELEEKAKGKIMVYNQYSSSPQSLVKTTRFLSESGKLFRLVETTTIPGATVEEGTIIPSSKEVEVEADEAGESYNIGPSKFTIPGFEGTPKYAGFYGESSESMSGGAKGKMRVATKDDIEGATEILALELKNKVEKEFNKKIPSELKLLKDSQKLEVIESTSNPKADEPGKEILISVKVRAWGLAFRERDIFDLIEKSIGDKISENKFLISSSIKVDYKKTEIDLEKGKAVFYCNVEADAAWNVNKDEIKNNLAGKDEIEVRKYLSSLSEIDGAKVIFWPFWVKKIPKNKDKIEVIIDTNI